MRRPTAFIWSVRSWPRCWPAADAPIDPGDGSGMNLMDFPARAPVGADGPGHRARLSRASCRHWPPRLLDRRDRSRAIGRIATDFPAANVVVWSGDNPCSLIGTGLVREGRLAVSLGTSDGVFGPDA